MVILFALMLSFLCTGILLQVVTPWILRPVFQKHVLQKSRKSFALGDIFSLTFLSAFSLLIVESGSRLERGAEQFLDPPETSILVITHILVLVVNFLVWQAAIRHLNNSGVVKPFQRFVYTVIAFPAGYLLPFTLCVILLMLLTSLLIGRVLYSLEVYFAVFLLSFSLLLTHFICRWVYNTGRTDENPKSSRQTVNLANKTSSEHDSDLQA